MIKRLKVVLFCLGAIALALPMRAQVISQAPLGYFGGTTTAQIGVTNANFIVPAKGGTARVQFLSATSDKAASVVAFYNPSASSRISIATNASQTFVYGPGSGTFTAGDYIVVRNLAADTYQRMTVASATTTNIVTSQSLTYAPAIGDIVYKMAKVGSIPVGAATKELNAYGGGIFNGAVNQPLLLDLDSTSAAGTLNVVSGIFVP